MNVKLGLGQELKDSIMVDALQALIGSVFVTKRYYKKSINLQNDYNSFLNKIITLMLNEFNELEADPKTYLQKFLQKFGMYYSCETKEIIKTINPIIESRITLHFKDGEKLTYIKKASSEKEASNQICKRIYSDIENVLSFSKGINVDEKLIKLKKCIYYYLDSLNNESSQVIYKAITNFDGFGIMHLVEGNYSKAYREIDNSIRNLNALSIDCFDYLNSALNKLLTYFEVNRVNEKNINTLLNELLHSLRKSFIDNCQLEYYRNELIDSLLIFQLAGNGEFNILSLNEILSDVELVRPRNINIKNMICENIEIYGNITLLQWLFYSMLSKLDEILKPQEDKKLNIELHIHNSN